MLEGFNDQQAYFYIRPYLTSTNFLLFLAHYYHIERLGIRYTFQSTFNIVYFLIEWPEEYTELKISTFPTYGYSISRVFASPINLGIPLVPYRNPKWSVNGHTLLISSNETKNHMVIGVETQSGVLNFDIRIDVYTKIETGRYHLSKLSQLNWYHHVFELDGPKIGNLRVVTATNLNHHIFC
jgi:hypothetical protein